MKVQEKLRKWIKNHKDELPHITHYNCVDEKGVYSCSGNSSNPHPGGYMYDIIHPITKGICPKPLNGWRWPLSTFLDYKNEGEVEWGKDHTTQPHIKKRIETVTDFLRSYIYVDNRISTRLLAELFDGNKIFDNPKPLSVLKRIIDYVSSSEDIILDFFSGSGTTAHAVMQLNAEDGGKRKYICVQLPESTPEKSAARKAGYDTICEIGKERLRRAGRQIKEAEENKDKPLDTGFRVLRVDSSNMKDIYFEPFVTTQESLFAENIKEDRSELDLLFGCMVDWGVELSYPLRQEEIGDKKIHIVNEGALVACFDETITLQVIRHIAQIKPQHVIFRENCFATDADKLNIYEQFKQLCGWSDEEAYRCIHVL